jgi:MGT family glycosyltransferase
VLPGASLPDGLTGLPDQPTVLASLGTVFNNTPGILEAIVEGAGQEPVNLIVAIGPDRDPTEFGSQPPNVHLRRYLPQPQLLAVSEVFITHCGFNSVKESLISGVPMVAIPITADQPYCAERCAALGMARVVPPDQVSPAALRSATWQVLGDPGYREHAGHFRDKMLALPGAGQMVELLEELTFQNASSAHTGVAPS